MASLLKLLDEHGYVRRLLALSLFTGGLTAMFSQILVSTILLRFKARRSQTKNVHQGQLTLLGAI